MVRRSIAANAAASIIARVVGAAAGLATAVVAARDLGTGAFGTYAAAVATLFVLDTLTTFGTDTLVVRDVASGRADAVSRSLGLQLAIAAPLALAGAVLVATGPGRPFGIAALGVVPGVWSTTALAVLRGRERMDLASVATVGGSLAALALAVAAAIGGGDVSTFVGAVVAGHVVSAVLAVALARGPGPGRWRPRIDRRFARATVPFALMVAATAVATMSGVIALELLGDDADAGTYAAAHRVAEGLRILPAAIAGAAFPALVATLDHRPIRLAARRGLALVTAAAAVVVVGAGPLIDVIYDGYGDSADVLRVLAIGLPVLALRLHWSFELLAAGAEDAVAAVAVVAAAVTVIATVAVAGTGPLAVAFVGVAGLTAHAGLLWDLRRRTVTIA